MRGKRVKFSNPISAPGPLRSNQKAPKMSRFEKSISLKERHIRRFYFDIVSRFARQCVT
jgi:hypothetical protein